MSFQASQYSDPADLSAVRSSRISSTSGKGFTTSCRLPSGPNYIWDLSLLLLMMNRQSSCLVNNHQRLFLFYILYSSMYNADRK